MPPRCHRAQQSAGRISAESSMAKCYPSAGRDDHWIPSPRCGWPLGKHLQFASKSPPFLHSFFHWKFPSIHISLAYLIFSVVRVAGGLEKNGGWPPLATSLRLQLPAGALLAVAPAGPAGHAPKQPAARCRQRGRRHHGGAQLEGGAGADGKPGRAGDGNSALGGSINQ